jgi:hypothetical protein
MSLRTKADTKVLILKEFLDCGTGVEFQNLKGKEGTQLARSLNQKLNSFWIHPTSFIAFGGPQFYRASTLAHLVIISLRDTDNDDKDPSPETNALYNLLVFLWAVKKGYTTLVTFSNPPYTDVFDAICQETISRLKNVVPVGVLAQNQRRQTAMPRRSHQARGDGVKPRTYQTPLSDGGPGTCTQCRMVPPIRKEFSPVLQNPRSRPQRQPDHFPEVQASQEVGGRPPSNVWCQVPDCREVPPKLPLCTCTLRQHAPSKEG